MAQNKAILVLENLRSVENTGSIFRTAEGLGVSKIILVGTTPAPTDRFGRRRVDFSKVALGAENLVEWEHIAASNLQFAISNLQKEGYQIISLEQSERSKDLRNFKPLEKFALIVGNEVDGVSKEALALSDEVVEIGMKGQKESLNVSVSAGIALFSLLG